MRLCRKVVVTSLLRVSWFVFTVGFALKSTWTTWLFTTASCRSWSGESFQGTFIQLIPLFLHNSCLIFSLISVWMHKGFLCSREDRRWAVMRTDTECQRICPLETKFRLFERCWSFGHNRSKLREDDWHVMVTRGNKRQNRNQQIA